MLLALRRVSLVAPALIAVFALASCGGGSSDQVVARIAGVTTISKAQLDHWIPVEAIVLYQEQPAGPVPKGLVPDPPEYADCIAYLRTLAEKPSTRPPQRFTTAELKGKCRNRYDELKVLALNTLIGWYWTIGAGAEFGVSASDAEITRRFHEFGSTFGGPAKYATYMRLTGQTVADMRLRSKVQVFEQKLLAKLTALQKQKPTPTRRAELAAFALNTPPNKRWASKTTCANGYVVSACKEYTGSEPPDIPN